MALSIDELREIYRKIWTGENPHSDFLTNFAAAVVWADGENIKLLATPAALLILKYKLHLEKPLDPPPTLERRD
ncbi:MAG: hypothetical protein ACR2GW_07125 [Pyrinomonadaceae bacterium]